MFSKNKASEVVLVVDDHRAVQQVIKATLIAEGYSVLGADDGLEAWQIVQRLPMAIDFVISDIDMPRMNGLELTRNLRAQYPELPILLMSGAFTSEVEAHLGPNVRFLQKPFDAREFLGMVRGGIERRWGSFVGKHHSDLRSLCA